MPDTLTSICPICKIQGDFKWILFEDASESIGVHSCPQCLQEYLYPQPSDVLLNKQYQNYSERRNKHFRDTKKTYFLDIISKINSIRSFHSLLEIGSGDGFFIEALREHHGTTSITAIEPFHDLSALSSPTTKIVTTPLEEWLNQNEDIKFDLICALDLLEHLRDPMATLTALTQKHLNPGGLIVATFPALDSLSHSLLGKLWPHYKIEHLWYPTKESIGVIEQGLGLERVFLVPNKKTLSVGYFLTILSGFGPSTIQKLGRILRKITPASLNSKNVTFSSGEWFWMAKKHP